MLLISIRSYGISLIIVEKQAHVIVSLNSDNEKTKKVSTLKNVLQKKI